MAYVIDEPKCVGCKLCVKADCGAIKMEIIKKQFKAVIDPEQCIDCGRCADLCPKNIITEGASA